MSVFQLCAVEVNQVHLECYIFLRGITMSLQCSSSYAITLAIVQNMRQSVEL